MRLERAADPHVARVQWDALIAMLEKECGATFERVAPAAGLPDMVFTANAGVVTGRSVILSRFRCPERRPEEEQFARWFEAQSYAVVRLPRELFFEGAGDLLSGREVWFGGHGQRSDIRAYRYLGSLEGRDIIPLELVDPRFYHLDVALTVLDETRDHIAYFPAAFSRSSRRLLAETFPDAITATSADAHAFGLNCVSDGRHVFVPAGAHQLREALVTAGYRPTSVDLSELIKGGGSVKCCTQEIRPAPIHDHDQP